MSDDRRVGKTIRQSYAAFWKEWIILAIAAVLIGQPGLVTGWIEAKAGAGIFEGLPAEMIIRGAGLLGVIYALIYKIGYDLLANRYTLNEEEVVEIYGIIQKNRRVTKLEHIRRVSVEIGIVGRILGYGDVLYFTAGSGGVDVRLKDIPNPEALAQEADELARRKQQQMAQGEGDQGSHAGNGSQASGQILDAFSETASESVAVQREILEAINALRAETRRSTAVLHAALKQGAGQPIASESESPAGNPDTQSRAEHAPESNQDDTQPEENPKVVSSEPDHEPELDPEPPVAEPEDEHYSSSPKMFDNWEDALAPTPRSEEVIEEDQGGDSSTDLEPTPSESEPDAEHETRKPVDPEPETRQRQKQQTEVPADDSEFVGLMAPNRK